MAMELEALLPGRMTAWTAQQPAELLDRLDGVDELIVCDACRSGCEAGSLHCWTWPVAALPAGGHSGSHDLSLPFVLALAERLGRLPRRVTIWGVELGQTAPDGPLTSAVRNAVPQLVRAIADDWCARASRQEGDDYA
jgi:hydrogenase maturation protease